MQVDVLNPYCVVRNLDTPERSHVFNSGENRLVGAQLLVSLLLTYKAPRFHLTRREVPIGRDSFERLTDEALVREDGTPASASGQPWDAPKRALKEIFRTDLGIDAEPIESVAGRRGYRLNPDIELARRPGQAL